MNIRFKLTLRFSLLVASILVAFSISVYLLSEIYRKEEFYSRLESRAITTARLLVSVEEVDRNLLRIIDKNSIHALYQEKVVVFDRNHQLVYSSLDDLPVEVDSTLFDQVKQRGKVEFVKNENEHVGISYSDDSGDYVIVASAYDRYGKSKLKNLRTVLWTGLLIGLGIIVLTGSIFARQMLDPIAKMNQEISLITAGNLEQRIDEGNQKDEIAQLAMNFNQMLERLEAAFQSQQEFVSNASHELRNPLAAMSGQLQTILEKERSAEAYRQTLHSLYEDTNRLVRLSNGLLHLAQSGVERQKSFFQPIRVDEVLFAAQNALSESTRDYHFQIEFDNFPDDESFLTIWGNEALLLTVFLNLLDNACKFSIDHTVVTRFKFDENYTYLQFTDNGIGIPPDEIEKVFQPFYRAANAITFNKGYGIGLSLCYKIVQLHRGAIQITSKLAAGTTLTVKLPRRK